MTLRTFTEYSICVVLGLIMSTAVSIAMVYLTDTEQPIRPPLIEGSIRLAALDPADELVEDTEKPQDEPEPPEDLDMKFTATKAPKLTTPKMQMPLPAFNADIHPALNSGIALPAGALGGLGFNMDEVDDVPQILRSVPAEYPYSAKRSRIEGEVVVRMLVRKNGKPDKLTIHSSNPVKIFDSAALSAAKRWRFKPGRYAGQDVDTWVLLPFNFELTQ